MESQIRNASGALSSGPEWQDGASQLEPPEAPTPDNTASTPETGWVNAGVLEAGDQAVHNQYAVVEQQGGQSNG